MNEITDLKMAFLYPRSLYYGSSTPEDLAFNSVLQDFAHQVSHICALETGGNLSAEEAFEGLERLWVNLERHRPKMSS
jgi:hypothetical protein